MRKSSKLKLKVTYNKNTTGEAEVEILPPPEIIKGWWTDDGNNKITEARIGDTVRFHIVTKNINDGEILNLTIRDWDGILNIDDYPKSSTAKKRFKETVAPEIGHELLSELKFQMMSIHIIICFLFLLVTCKGIKPTYYHGYLYDINGKPLDGLMLIGRDHKDVKSISNKQGYFKMDMRKNWIESYIYIYDEGQKIDSISIVRTHPEYGVRYYFVEGRQDTLFISLRFLNH